MTRSRWIIAVVLAVAIVTAGVLVLWRRGSDIESPYWLKRMHAVEETDDQAVLAKLATQDPEQGVRLAATRKLTDQSLLAKMAIAAIRKNDEMLCREATARLTDQAALTAVALGSGESQTRIIAIKKLADQNFLASLAIEEPEEEVCKAIVEKLTDQQLLDLLATTGPAKYDHDSVDFVHHQHVSSLYCILAARKLTDPTLRERAEGLSNDPLMRQQLVAELPADHPSLVTLAGRCRICQADAGTSIARLKMVVNEPKIQERLPGLLCTARIKRTSEDYYDGSTVTGENISLTLHRSEGVCAERTWSTEFPGSILKSDAGKVDYYYLPAVHVEQLVGDLLHMSVFTDKDIAELLRSRIPEVRFGAAVNCNDGDLLAKISAEDEDETVRAAAKERLDKVRHTER